MRSYASFCVRLDEKDKPLSKGEITRRIGDFNSAIYIGKDSLEITGATKPFVELKVEGLMIRVSPVQKELLLMVNAFEWKSLRFLHVPKILIKNDRIVQLVATGMVEISKDRQRITVKEGVNFFDTVVELTSILQDDEEDNTKRRDDGESSKNLECEGKRTVNEHTTILQDEDNRKRRDYAESSKKLECEGTPKMKFKTDIRFRLLCPVSQVPGFIGKGGEKVKMIGHKSSACVSVITEVPPRLKTCSKRIVQVTGSYQKTVRIRELDTFGSFAQMGVVLVADAIMTLEDETKASILVDCDCFYQNDLESLQKSSKAQFKVKHAPKVAEKNEVEIKICGTRNEVHTALVSVTALLQQRHKATSGEEVEGEQRREQSG